MSPEAMSLVAPFKVDLAPLLWWRAVCCSSQQREVSHCRCVQPVQRAAPGF